MSIFRANPRIVANYLRLGLTFVLGLMLVRILVGFGEDVYGLTVLLAAGGGFAALIKDITQAGLVPTLGAAFHAGKRDFDQTYASAQVLALGGGALCLFGFALVAWSLPHWQIPPALLPAARWFIYGKALHAVVAVVLAPICTMVLVREWMLFYNVGILLDRVADVLAAATLVTVLPQADAAAVIWWYGTLSAALAIVFILGTAILVCIRDPSLIPRLGAAGWAPLRRVLRSSCEIGLFLLAMCFYIRFDNLVMNQHFGLAGNLVFGVAVQLTGYIRQTTQGLIVGLDAIAARLHSRRETGNALRLLHRATQMQAAVVFPCLLCVLLFADDLIQLWVGARLENPTEALPRMAMITQLMMVGFAARSLTEGWTNILNGAGKVRSYLPGAVSGSAANVVIVTGCSTLMTPDRMWYVPAATFAVLMVAVHVLWLGRIVAREYGLRFTEVTAPMIWPLVATLLSSLLLAPIVARWYPLASVSGGATVAAWSLLYVTLVVATLHPRQPSETGGAAIALETVGADLAESADYADRRVIGESPKQPLAA